jgi:hypothetical protein
MEDPSRGASIFYTTDGWTPTAASKRYVGPITVRQSVTLQAIAIVAGGLRSYISALPVQPGSGSLTPPSLRMPYTSKRLRQEHVCLWSLPKPSPHRESELETICRYALRMTSL